MDSQREFREGGHLPPPVGVSGTGLGQMLGIRLHTFEGQGVEVDPHDVAKLSPLMHKHINFLGRYAFFLPEPIANGQLRPLRTLTSATAFRSAL